VIPRRDSEAPSRGAIPNRDSVPPAAPPVLVPPSAPPVQTGGSYPKRAQARWGCATRFSAFSVAASE